MPKTKSRYRIVPTTNEKYGACWSLKDGDVEIGTFISKQFAERRKLQLESKVLEDFLLISTRNQEIKIED
jgi:hypothetical protein